MIHSGRKTTVPGCFHLNQEALSTTSHTCSTPCHVPEVIMTFLGGDDGEALVCSCIIDVIALWLTRTLVGVTTMLSRMNAQLFRPNFPSSLIDTSVFFIFFISLVPIFYLTSRMVTDNYTFHFGQETFQNSPKNTHNSCLKLCDTPWYQMGYQTSEESICTVTPCS